MAASPETAEPQGSSDTLSSPNPPSPGLHPTQESPSLTTSAPPEMANPDHATLVLPPPVDQSTVEHSEMDQLPPTPIDEAEPPPSHPPPPEAAPAASPAFEAIPPEKVASPSSLPEDVAVEFSPQVTASAPSPSPSPSPQIVGTSPEDVPQPSSPPPPRTPPATATHASTDPSSTSAIAMASEEEAARPSPATESTDGDSRTAATPLTPPVESGPEGSLPQQQPRPPSLEMALLLCENLEPAQPLPPCHPSECRDSSPDTTVDEVVEGTFEKALPMPESTDVDMDITTGVLPALEIRSEEMLSQQQSRPPYPEMVPPQGENSKFTQSPQSPPPSESTYDWLNAAMNEVSALASEEATAALEFGAERSLQEPGKTSMTSRMETEPCSPEMAPPGFKDFKSQWLPLSLHAPPAESTHNVVQVAATNQMDISPGLLPPLKSVEEGRSQQPLPGSCSPITEAAPCSPDMPPPGFENCKSSWLPVATLPPIAETTYALPDAASTKAVSFVEKACSVPALEAMDVETDRERCQLPLLESGTGNLLQGLPPRSPSPTMQAAPFSPDTTPPGFKDIKLTQLQLPSPPLVQPAHVLQALVANENMHMTSEEAPRSSSAWKAMDLDMDGTPAVAPPSESEAGKSLPPEPPLVPSHVAQHTVSSLVMVSSGSENMESSHSPLQPAAVLPLDETPDTLADAGTKTVTVEELCHPLPVTGTAEEANGSNLPPALENGREGLLPHVEPHTSSDAVHEAPTSLEIASTSFENLESSQQTSHCLAETNPSADASATVPAIVKSDKTSLALSPLQDTDTDMESATLQQLPLKSEEGLLSQSEKHPSSPSVKDTTCSPEDPPPGYKNLDSLEQLPPPPPLSTKFEMGQMVCGCCRQLLAYPRGAVHVQCFGCWTINLVLEEHQVGNVRCGQCDTLLMYPFGAPAVKCSNCLFVTEIGERNVRPKISMKQSVSPRPQELAHQS